MNNQNFEILKSDSDRKLVFGWASVAITVNGEQLEDRQQDIIDPDDLEEAAYEYVLNFRDTGEEHIPTMRKKGKLVESCVLTAEKQKAMGIPEGAVPVGWWIGFKIEDDAAWERVKSGQYRMFSIEGKANRIPVEKSRSSYDEYPSYSMWLEENLDATIEQQNAAKEYYQAHKDDAERDWKWNPDRKDKPVAKTFADVLKFNPNHDRLGRFASAGNGGGQTFLFNITHYRKMLEHPDIKAIMANRDFEYYGIRVQEEDTETVGKVMTHHSVNEGGDFENNEWMSDEDKERLEDLAGELDGVSTIGIYDIEQVGKYGGYPGKVAYLLGSDEPPETGYDPGEAVMKEPTVLAKMEYKDGKIIVKDKVQIQPEAESKPKPESATQTNARQENPGYTKFMAEMKAKYGDDMWSNMTDSEMDAADRWESHRYDPVGKSAVAKTFDEILKFNPYHDSHGRFASENGYASFTIRTKNPDKQYMADMAIARQKEKTPDAGVYKPKPKKNFDEHGFADYDEADYHQLYNGKQYYKQQQLTSEQRQAADNYLEAHTELYSLYSHSQNLNYQMATGQELTGKYKQTHDGLMSAMHNIGYNVELTRYDHADSINGMIKALGAGTNYEHMTQDQLTKALVGQTLNENKFISTSYNNFKNAPASTTKVFDSRAVKINYKVKADTKAMMPGVGAGGDFGEMILAPTNGTSNRGGKIVGVRLTGEMVRRKGTQIYDQPRIEIDIEI